MCLFCLWLTWCKDEEEDQVTGSRGQTLNLSPASGYSEISFQDDFACIARVWNGILPWRFCGLGLLSYPVTDRARREIFWCKGRFYLARGILKPFCTTQFRVFFFSLYFLKSVIRKCVFSLKEIKQGPRRASLIVVKYIYTSSPFYVFTCCLLLFAPVACFHPHYFGWHWKFCLGPLCSVQRTFRGLTKPSRDDYILQNILFLGRAV